MTGHSAIPLVLLSLLAAATAAGCQTVEAPEAYTFDRIWSASHKAALEHGFRVVEEDARRGIIVAERTEGAARWTLRIYVEPSQAGYVASAVIRSAAAVPTPGVEPPRTDRRPVIVGSGRYMRPDLEDTTRDYEEEHGVIESIRMRLGNTAGDPG